MNVQTRIPISERAAVLAAPAFNADRFVAQCEAAGIRPMVRKQLNGHLALSLQETDARFTDYANWPLPPRDPDDHQDLIDHLIARGNVIHQKAVQRDVSVGPFGLYDVEIDQVMGCAWEGAAPVMPLSEAFQVLV